MTTIRYNPKAPSGFTGTTPKPDNHREIRDNKPPAKRGFQSVPTPDVLAGLIKRAVEAMREGVYWDRGSILNIEV